MINDDFSCTADLEKPEPLAQFGGRSAERKLSRKARAKRAKKITIADNR